MNRRRLLGAVGAGTALTVGSIGTLSRFQDRNYSRDGHYLTGITPTDDVSTLLELEEWANHQHAVVVTYSEVDIPSADIAWTFRDPLSTIWERGSVPLLMMQPEFSAESVETATVLPEIAAGEHDSKISEWANHCMDWITRGIGKPDRRLYINLAPEMNGDWNFWSPVSNAATEADFVEMWHRVYDIFADTGLGETDVQWIWALDTSTRGVDVSACYPGDAYVDWGGVHGYNWADWGGWRDPVDHYDTILEQISSITDRPIAFTEFGTSAETSDAYDPARKDGWIEDAYRYFRERGVKMACWFNIDSQADWAVFGGAHGTTTDMEGTQAYSSYKKVLGSSDALGAHPKHPRNLTDQEFHGRF